MLFSGSLWMASSESRRIRSASASERVTCWLFRTRSTGSLESLCLTRICLQRTCFAGSTFGRLAAGSAAARAFSRPHSRKAQSTVRLPEAPRTCASCRRAPEATRGRPKCLLRISAMSSCDRASAISPPTNAKHRWRSCRTTLSTSGVARTSGGGRSAASGSALAAAGLKARSPKARETCSSSPPSPWEDRSACRPCGPFWMTVPPAARMRPSSDGVAGECAGVRRESSSWPSCASSPSRAALSPRLATKSRWPVTSAMTALQPSLALPLARNSASRSSQLARSAPAISESSQGPLNSESLGKSFLCKFRATNSAHVGGAASSAPSVEPAEPWFWSAPPVATGDGR
mmetsp:Transcript_16178/g.46227  ORF Transcript_16178/g.46227 Transcript_16178/m.46227 type:complete len:346 (-) Transcript_16178:468-1505(-)